jgi:hypothetical protein
LHTSVCVRASVQQFCRLVCYVRHSELAWCVGHSELACWCNTVSALLPGSTRAVDGLDETVSPVDVPNDLQPHMAHVRHLSARVHHPAFTIEEARKNPRLPFARLYRAPCLPYKIVGKSRGSSLR